MTQGITQRIMAKIVDLNPSSISKYIASNYIKSIPSGNQRNLRYSEEATRAILYNLFTKKVKIKKSVLSFYNFKGGVGKTSLCFQISSLLSFMGFNVLVVDADPQGHLSTSFGVDGGDNTLTIYDAIAAEVSVVQCVKKVFDGLDIIPANLSLTRVENLLNELPKREERVKIVIDPIKDKYDFIIFDTNPTISHLNKNILGYSDLINIVVETQAYALNGLTILMAEIKRFFSKMQVEIPKLLIIPNKYEDRTANSVEAMSALVEFYSEYIKPDFAIRRSEDFNTSAKMSLPVPMFCRNTSIALEDIIEITHYIIQKVQNSEQPKE